MLRRVEWRRFARLYGLLAYLGLYVCVHITGRVYLPTHLAIIAPRLSPYFSFAISLSRLPKVVFSFSVYLASFVNILTPHTYTRRTYTYDAFVNIDSAGYTNDGPSSRNNGSCFLSRFCLCDSSIFPQEIGGKCVKANNFIYFRKYSSVSEFCIAFWVADNSVE